MLLQAFDFVHLYDEHQCELQIGGSDQWGNITAGIDLARRMRAVQLYGVTCPLLTRADGMKMGKTESGAVWLSPDRTSPYAFYQYWINVADEDAGTCLRFLTEVEHEEIDQLDRERVENPSARQSQYRLAETLTELVHGSEGVREAKRASEVLFGAAIENLTDRQLASIFADVPSKSLSRDRLGGEGLPLIDALMESGLVQSRGEARRTVKQGGAYVNNRRAENADVSLTVADLASESVVVLRRGRKNYALLRFEKA